MNKLSTNTRTKRASLPLLLSIGLTLLVQAPVGEAWIASQAFPSSLTHSSGIRNPTTKLEVSSLDDLSRRRRRGEKLDENPFSAYLQDKLSISKEKLGIGILLTVPLVWGTYAPVVQLLNQADPMVPGPVFSASYFGVAAAATSALTMSTAKSTTSSPTTEEDADTKPPIWQGMELGAYVFFANALHVIGLQTVPADRAGFLLQLSTVFVPLVEALFARDLFAISGTTWGACLLALVGIGVMGVDIPNPFDTSFLAKVENFEASMENVGANIRTGITDLKQQPLLHGVMDKAHGNIALDNSAMSMTDLAVDGSGDGLAAAAIDQSTTMGAVPFLDGLTEGDFFIVAAALLYSLNIIRLGHWTSRTKILDLTNAKTVAEAFYGITFVGASTAASSFLAPAQGGPLAFLQSTGDKTTEFFADFASRWSEGAIDPTFLAVFGMATVWTGVMSTAYVVFAQGIGQKTTSASDANLIYSLQPIFNALFAFALLHEAPTPSGFVGGSLIGAAVYMIASSSFGEESKESKMS